MVILPFLLGAHSHGPNLIGLLRHCQCLRLFPVEPLSGVDPQVELQSLVNPIDPLMVPFRALDVTQIEVTKVKSPVTVIVR